MVRSIPFGNASRRDVLALLTATGAGAALLPLAAACAPKAGQVQAPASVVTANLGASRATLERLVTDRARRDRALAGLDAYEEAVAEVVKGIAGLQQPLREIGAASAAELDVERAFEPHFAALRDAYAKVATEAHALRAHLTADEWAAVFPLDEEAG